MTTRDARYLLDTNILVHFVRSNRLWGRIRARYDLFVTTPRPLISVVTKGELRSLALQCGWGRSKREQVEFCLGYFETLSIDDPRIIDLYATIDSHFQRRGHTFGKNDLWIAATAASTGARLLTTDRDFLPLAGVFIGLDWFDPDEAGGEG